MDAAQQRFIIQQIEKVVDSVADKSDDITEVVVRFEGKKLRQVDLKRHLSRFD